MARKTSLQITVRVLLVVFCCCARTESNAGNTFYVDPVGGSMSGDGSAANPWSTLEAVFDNNLVESREPAVFPYNGTLAPKNPGAPVKAGDTIKLLSGYHGDLLLRGYFNQSDITIEAKTGHTPTLRGFQIQGGENWTLRGLTVSPELAGVADSGDIVYFETHSWWGPASHMSIEDSTVYTVADSSGWSASDWTSKAANSGIRTKGSDFVIRNNHIKNISFGIRTSGDDIVADSNTILNFSGDGMRGGGDRVTFENNTIKWSYDVDGNHDDAIQFFQGFGVPSYDVVLRGNTIETYADPAHPLTHGSQGIGNFDGPYINWVVENNVVKVAHYHGISVYDAQNAVIANNTILDVSGQFDSWIQLPNSTGSTVRNNLVPTIDTGGSTGLTADHNVLIGNPNVLNNVFRDWQNGDLRLKGTGLAVDAGSNLLAPTTDIDGRPRPIGPDFDIGAYEYTLDGDFDSDGDVDGDDFLHWQRGNGIQDGATPADGDGNADHAVNDLDLAIWQGDFGSALSSSVATSTTIPEPATGVLLALAGVPAILFRKGGVTRGPQAR